jgi:hypothetical protein
MINHAHPTPSSAAAHVRAPASRPLELLEARRLRDLVAALLRKEQSAMAEFLVALSDFDGRRGWEALGHASLFAFLVAELRLSNSAAFYRKSAARLLQDFPEVIEPLRDGRLCLSTIAELAKVMTEENRAVVAPRFFRLSAREAQELVAELQPRPAPPLRDVMTSVTRLAPNLRQELPLPSAPLRSLAPASSSLPAPSETRLRDTYSTSLLTSEVPPTHPARVAPKADEIEPLTADLTRLHFTVRRRVVKKLEAARKGLGHAIRNATNEQALEAALDLLLEKQARARGLVKRPRSTLAAAPASVATARGETTRPAAATGVETARAAAAVGVEAEPSVEAQGAQTSPQKATQARTPHASAPPLALILSEPPSPRRTGPRETIPAAVRRAVWERDRGRCTWPLDSGGCCGSTHALELDHVYPWARDGEPTVANLRVVCRAHNAIAARQAFGARWMSRYEGNRRST